MNTPDTTRMLFTEAGRTPVGPDGRYYISRLIGGTNFSPRNTYTPSNVMGPSNLVPGRVVPWTGAERMTSWQSVAPARYGSYIASPAPVPAFAQAIFDARPSPTATGWTVTVGSRVFAVASIPATRQALEMK